MTAIVLRSDARRLPLPDASVDLIVTSPPYFALRDYRDGTESLEGQIGAEATPAEYIAALLDCTREWMRVLKPSGSIFVNLGDKYSQFEGARKSHGRSIGRPQRESRGEPLGMPVSAPTQWGIAPKSLMLLPERYRIGCVDDLGLIARAVIIWAKPNGMPESVTDRVRRSHEDWVHLTKLPRYFSAVDEIRMPLAVPDRKAGRTAFNARSLNHARTGTGVYEGQNPLGALPGSVWEVATQPLTVPAELEVDHYAAFPMEFPRRIILGWSPSGICAACGEGRTPLSSKQAVGIRRESSTSWNTGSSGLKGRVDLETPRDREVDVARTITGYACACTQPAAPTRPAVVLDPFGGTGTTALVASAYGRAGISVDRSADYCRIAQWRTTDPGERARALGVAKPPPVTDDQIDLFGMGEIA